MALKLARLHSVLTHRLRLEKVLRRSNWEHWRAPSVTSQKIVDVCSASGLVCIGQEIINWGHKTLKMIDCLSILTRSGSRWDRPNVVVRNPYFMAEAMSAHAISEVYASLRPPLTSEGRVGEQHQARVKQCAGRGTLTFLIGTPQPGVHAKREASAAMSHQAQCRRPQILGIPRPPEAPRIAVKCRRFS